LYHNPIFGRSVNKHSQHYSNTSHIFKQLAEGLLRKLPTCRKLNKFSNFAMY
jgi:hypothetical protein